ncbi:hypothetical protein NDU88_004044 [Pleurodeles waltl]|uniref:Uncharacterized protein n=1 Tax=Pleurodeles waltl TaxID=8319 RepID=A0AAV7VFY7_PLEWA|nr:hypothetical protein NDU88_004044 [Pleurodeles waltl]
MAANSSCGSGGRSEDQTGHPARRRRALQLNRAAVGGPPPAAQYWGRAAGETAGRRVGPPPTPTDLEGQKGGAGPARRAGGAGTASATQHKAPWRAETQRGGYSVARPPPPGSGVLVSGACFGRSFSLSPPLALVVGGGDLLEDRKEAKPLWRPIPREEGLVVVDEVPASCRPASCWTPNAPGHGISGGRLVAQGYWGHELGVRREREPLWLSVGAGLRPGGRWRQQLVICATDEEVWEVRPKSTLAKMRTPCWGISGHKVATADGGSTKGDAGGVAWEQARRQTQAHQK